MTLLPTATLLRSSPLIRVDVGPGRQTGLRERSQVMIDKPTTLARTKVGQVVGEVDEATMISVSRALAAFLGFA